MKNGVNGELLWCKYFETHSFFLICIFHKLLEDPLQCLDFTNFLDQSETLEFYFSTNSPSRFLEFGLVCLRSVFSSLEAFQNLLLFERNRKKESKFQSLVQCPKGWGPKPEPSCVCGRILMTQEFLRVQKGPETVIGLRLNKLENTILCHLITTSLFLKSPSNP